MQHPTFTYGTGTKSMNILCDYFPGHMIFRFVNVPWSSRTPDLNMCDFSFVALFKIESVCAPYVTRSKNVCLERSVADRKSNTETRVSQLY